MDEKKKDFEEAPPLYNTKVDEPPAYATTTHKNAANFLTEEKSPIRLKVFVKFMEYANGKTQFSKVPLFVDSKGKISSVKIIIQQVCGISFARQRLIYAGKQLSDDQTLLQCNIQEESVLTLILRMPVRLECVNCELQNANRYYENEAYIDTFQHEAKFQIFVKTMSGRSYTLRVAPHFTIKQTKALLGHYTGKDKLYPEDVRFIFGGKQLSDDRCLKDYKVQEQSTLHFVLRLWGGGIVSMHYDEQSGNIFIGREHGIDATIKISSFHVSCKSDKIDGQNMAGVVLYAYNNKTDWNLNGVHCKSGYIILKSSDKIKHIDSKQGQVHGKCYKSVFKQDINKKAVGGGFAFVGKEWKFNSYSFNVASNYHDDKKAMHPLEQQCILAAIENWRKGIQNTKCLDIRKKYKGYCKKHNFY
eukprot:105397_1